MKGVKIRGMKMPESCAECTLKDFHLDYIVCKVTNHFFRSGLKWRKERHELCPLEESSETEGE